MSDDFDWRVTILSKAVWKIEKDAHLETTTIKALKLLKEPPNHCERQFLLKKYEERGKLHSGSGELH